jgi:tetratricopeptide (TPR) repeat protein
MAAEKTAIKVFLGSIKDTLLDDDDDNNNNSTTTTATNAGGGDDDDAHVAAASAAVLYETLLKLELILRGVTAATTATMDTSGNGSQKQPPQQQRESTNKLLETIQAAAGKSLLLGTTSGAQLPLPLLTGCSVMAGRVAEKLAAQICAAATPGPTTSAAAGAANNTNSNDSGSILLLRPPSSSSSSQQQQWSVEDRAVRAAVLRRCQEVDDDRFRTLLELEKCAASSSPSSTTLSEILYVIAEGYLLQAAAAISASSSSAPDAVPPPIWKRAWDCCVAGRQQETTRDHPKNDAATAVAATTTSISWEAVLAVSNLRTIATSRGNRKRAAELALILADCYLDNLVAPAVSTSADSTTTAKKIWLAPHRSIVRETRADAVAGAAKCLLVEGGIGDVRDAQLLSDVDRLYYQTLRYRVLRAQEENAIRTVAEQDWERARNRAVDGTGLNTTKTTATSASTSASLQECIAKNRQKRLGGERTDRSKILACAVELMSATTRIAQEENSSGTNIHSASACHLLGQHISWLQESAQAMAVLNQDPSGWSDLAEFVTVLLLHWREKYSREDTINISLEILTEQEVELMETACIVVPCIEWMCCGARTSLIFSSELLEHTIQLLVLLGSRRATIQEQDKSSSVIASNARKDSQLVMLKRSLETTRVLLHLSLTDGDGNENSNLAIITESAVKRSLTEPCADLGLSFFEMLACWSGFHRSPWPFCTQPEARQLVHRARACLDEAIGSWGRPVSAVENLVTALAAADAEGAAFDGGLVQEACAGYMSCLSSVELLSIHPFREFVEARCHAGLAQLTMRETSDSGSTSCPSADALAQSALQSLQSLSLDETQALILWHSGKIVSDAAQYQIATTRQLIATVLLRRGETVAAQEVLERALQDAPQDPTAAFALGSFRLYSVFFGEKNLSATDDKAAQVQLLRAAKLDSSKAGPFALLGYWYEYKNDSIRAIGCYSKALLLDPSHPVAGRGILRLAPAESHNNVCEKAIDSASPLIGWAWHTVGIQKALEYGEDEFAVVALLKALRCRDVERPEADQLSGFFGSPSQPVMPGKLMLSKVLSDLAGCYRRLGRYTASIRSYHAAIEAARENVSSALLCSCAQVEVELGLFDDAEDKFSKALNLDEDLKHVAAYGKASALLSMARRDCQDGKAGSSYDFLRHAVDCSRILDDSNHVCARKLKGELFTFGAMLPPDVFAENNDNCVETKVRELTSWQSQLSFVEQGEAAFRVAISLVREEDEDSNLLRASLFTDVGANILLRAQITWHLEGKGVHDSYLHDAVALFGEAASEFQEALQLSPTFAPAWCGLGCTKILSDPLFAQHAFSRSLQLDRLFPDSYANLCFLYTAHKCFKSSSLVSDALTDVADTPMMWINQALMLEIDAAAHPSTEASRAAICQAADAYRAALQVVKHPRAMLGLTMTCRMTPSDSSETVDPTMLHESHLSSSEYLGIGGSCDFPSLALNGIFKMEVGLLNKGSSHDKELIAQGRVQIQQAVDGLRSEDLRQTKLDLDVLYALTEDFSDAAKDSDERTTPVIDATVQRQVVHEPNRGDLWLELAKHLALLEVDHREGAALAAERAVSILTKNLARDVALPRSYGRHFVKAGDLTDALALSYWLANCATEIQNANVSDDNQDQNVSADKCTQRGSVVDLQRALLINPGNALAREALLSVP